ncbi:hypothetical protein SAMN05444008_101387 [Cnuella takakiae]|uniref:DUF5675 domain-containing protein n=1 Tax=Cnuella takakiae TaxID=1302690 RepID=A0A1M4TDD5_9BACT|nr:DUF5675 family protein [Cnuella takakiae]OLY90714.1 hypothetical protein BUE76_01480 [Cnuella takakiae]SHE42450.1 hypothetical protein SAMN05444008_101387 [Cnuella takakiae]
MELLLTRSMDAWGCNGELLHEEQRLCYTLELPFQPGGKRLTPVAEGRYPLARRYSPRFGHHLQVKSVPGRSLLCIHALQQDPLALAGGIAPVAALSEAGSRTQSSQAMEGLNQLVYPALEKEPVFLTIKNKNHEPDPTHTGAHA